MADIQSLKEKIKSTIYPNGRGAINAADHQAMLLEMVDGMGETDERIKENEVLIEDLQNTKIDKEADDYYPQLSVGLADNLVGVDVVDSSFTFRKSGGGAIADGTARIEAIKGNSVVWNQMVDQWNFSTLSSKWQTQSSSIAVVNNELVITANGATNVLYQEKFLANHKYRIAFEVKSASKNPRCRIGLFDGNSFVVNEYVQVANDKFTNVELIVSPNTECSAIYIRPDSDVSLTSGEKAYIRNFIINDLTKAFPIDTPTTIEEFYQRIPRGIDLNAYNDGTIINMSADGIKSVGFNQWDEQWENGYFSETGEPLPSPNMVRSINFMPVLPSTDYYYGCSNSAYKEAITIIYYDKDKRFISSATKLNLVNKTPSNAAYMKIRLAFGYGNTYNHDICINLSDASVNGKYFPYIKRIQSLDIIGKYFPGGMRSAGTAHDEIRYNKTTQKWEKVQRIGSVEMGSLNWSQGNGDNYVNSFYAQNALPDKANGQNILCRRYATNTKEGWPSNIDVDKAINSHSGDDYKAGIWIHDSSYTDAATLKASLQGVILFYELAEPLVTILDDTDNLDYEVWNGGTEEVLSDTPSAPLSAEIAYGFNAVGKIKELEETISNLPSGESSVFWAVYEQTKYEEIVAAYNEGKIVACHYDNKIYLLSYVKSYETILYASEGNNSYAIKCSNKNVWSGSAYPNTHSLKTLDNGNVELNIAGQTAEVATPQYVENLLGVIINGDY